MFPFIILYFPDAHCEHDPPFTPAKPALQEQAVLPAGESELAGQLTQLAIPLAALYVPATHCKHTPPLSPEEPGLQMQ